MAVDSVEFGSRCNKDWPMVSRSDMARHDLVEVDQVWAELGQIRCGSALLGGQLWGDQRTSIWSKLVYVGLLAAKFEAASTKSVQEWSPNMEGSFYSRRIGGTTQHLRARAFAPLEDGAVVHVYDPKVQKEEALIEFRYHELQVDESKLVFSDSPKDAVDGATCGCLRRGSRRAFKKPRRWGVALQKVVCAVG